MGGNIAGAKGAIAKCPACGKYDGITWEPKTDTCKCSCGWSDEPEKAEYIDREAAINQFTTNGGVFVYGAKGVAAIISRLRMIPAADVVDKKVAELLEKQLKERFEVVRCKECKQLKENKEGYYCYWWNRRIFLDDFCSYGERKEGNNGNGAKD